MGAKFLHAAGVVLLAILVTLVVWQGSFSINWFRPQNAGETYILWAVSTLIFLLMVTLGFMLARTFARLYVDRRRNQEGSQIRTKLVLAALALSSTPVFFLVLWGIYILNNSLAWWFAQPAQNIQRSLVEVNLSFEAETQRRADAQARWIAALPETAALARSGQRVAGFDARFCHSHDIYDAELRRADGTRTVLCSGSPPAGALKLMTGAAEGPGFEVVVGARMPTDLAARQEEIEREVRKYKDLARLSKEIRSTYVLLLLLISLFVLFLATWLAQMFAKQIGRPISALLEAAGELRRGNLDHRVATPAQDELATLVRVFNEMAAEIQASERELERRRNFTEAILESIPSGVISLSAERRIQRSNKALAAMFGAERVEAAARLDDLFRPEDVQELHYLLNRARRTGLASTQFELHLESGVSHVAVTVAALVGKHTSGWVIVLEDTSELLRAQKAAAWHEVARRIAHEIKNPLTPIALSAERIARQIDRAEQGAPPADVMRIVKQCSMTISSEVQSVKTLVDEFSQFARFPAAQPVPEDLNDIVRGALDVFQGRLDGVAVEVKLDPSIPAVMADREQFKRVIVNLVDNAAEAMQQSPLRRLRIETACAGADTIELSVTDTGHGVSPEDRERLFLPYFSTKRRGTGLGLAIVHHIVQEHGAQIRVEENKPQGTRFVIEMQAAAEARPAGTPA